MAGETLSKLFVKIEADTSGFTGTLAKVQGKMQATAGKMKKSGMAMTKGITAPLVAIGATAMKVGVDFEDAMVKSTAIMGDVSTEMRNSLEKTARDVALTTDKSAKEAGEAYYYLASAGMDAKQSMEALPQVANFATAGQFDMATATDLLTDAQSALGMASDDATKNLEEMTRLSDVLTQAQNLANASTQQFSEALTNQAGTALKSVNKSVEEGTAVLMTFADKGLKGSRAGNTLARTLDYMQQAQDKNAGTWERMNMNIYDSEGNMKHIADIVEMMEKNFAGLSDQQLASEMSAMGFTAETQKTMKMLMGSSGQIREYEEALNDAGGATEEIAGKQMQSMKKQLGLLKDGLVDAGLSIYEMLAPAIKEVILPALQGLVKVIRKVSKWMGGLPKPIKIIVSTLAILLASIGPLLVAGGMIMGAIANIMPLLGALSGAFTAIVGVLSGPVLLAIGAVVLAFVFWDDIVGIVKMVWTIMTDFAKFMGKAFLDAFGKAKDYIVRVFKNVWKSIKKFVPNILKKAGELIDGLVETFKNIWSGIKGVMTTIVKGVSNFFTGIIDTAKEFGGSLVESFTKLWENVEQVFSNMWEAVKNVFKNATNAVLDIVVPLVEGLIEFVTEIVRSFLAFRRKVQEVFKKVLSGVVSIVVDMVTKVKEKIDPFVEALVGSFMWMKDRIVGIFNTMWNGIKKIINWVIAGVNKMIEGLNKFSIDVPDWVTKTTGISTFGFNISKLPKLKEGGNISLSGLGIVGDDGPEIVDLPRGATVTPIAQTGGSPITIKEMVVRKESDINKIAKKLDFLQKQKDRRLGP